MRNNKLSVQCQPKAHFEALVWAARGNWRPAWNSGL